MRGRSLYTKVTKRVLDFTLSLVAIFILCPLMLLLTVLGAIMMRGNPLFVQKRPGWHERIYKMIKFRTMNNNKDSFGNLLPDKDRLNRYGRFLRASSLDELPELFNILKGDMSFVGPRPLAVVYLPYYTKKEHQRHSVRPGLTGWAQVNGRNAISWEAKFEYDLEYIQRISFLMDVRIIVMTIKKVFLREGIGQGEEIPNSLHIERASWLDESGSMKDRYQRL